MKLVTFALLLLASVYAFAGCNDRVASSDKLAEASACEIKQFDVKVIADLVARGMSEEDIDELADNTPMDEVRLDRIHKWVKEALAFHSKGNLSAWVMAHQEKCE
jgi:hypothetical protein